MDFRKKNSNMHESKSQAHNKICFPELLFKFISSFNMVLGPSELGFKAYCNYLLMIRRNCSLQVS